MTTRNRIPSLALLGSTAFAMAGERSAAAAPAVDGIREGGWSAVATRRTRLAAQLT